MTRHALRIPSIVRPSSWLAVGVGLVLYAALLWILPMARSWPESPTLWWLAQALAPIVYGALVCAFVPRATWPRRIGAAALLWAAHLLLGVIGEVAASLQSSAGARAGIGFPAPLPQFLLVPLFMIPFQDMIAGEPRSRHAARTGRERVSAARRQAPASVEPSASSAPAATVVAPALRVERPLPEARERRGDAGARAVTMIPEPIQSPVTPPPAAAAATAAAPDAAPLPARRVLDEMLARETSAAVVRVSFARVAEQIPAAAFTVALDRMGGSLPEPGYLLVPQRLVLAQVAEGIVRAGWETVSEQFPRNLMALNDAEISRRLRDGQLVLPLDELVPQLPSELFRAAGPVLDLTGIEHFPEPFKPLGAAPGVLVEGPRAASVSAPAPPATEPLTAGTTAIVDSAALAASTPAPAQPTDAVAQDELKSESDSASVEGERFPREASVAPALFTPEPAECAPPSAEHPGSVGTAARETVQAELTGPVLERIETAHTAPFVEDAEALAPAAPAVIAEVGLMQAVVAPIPPTNETIDLGGAAAEDLRSPVSTRERHEGPDRDAAFVEPIPVVSLADPGRDDDVADALEIARALAPVGPLNAAADTRDGLTFLRVSHPGLDPSAATTAANVTLPVLTEGRAPWPIEQMTFRGAAGAFVLTPLASSRAQKRILVASAPSHGSLALLEILCRRVAARETGSAERPRSASGGGEGEFELVEVEPSTRTREIGATLSAVGAVVTSIFQDAETETVFCLFLAADSDAYAVAGFARELGQAMRKTDGGAEFHNVEVMGDGHRLMLRLPDLGGGCADVVVVAGGRIDRRGLAHRQLECAARALQAV